MPDQRATVKDLHAGAEVLGAALAPPGNDPVVGHALDVIAQRIADLAINTASCQSWPGLWWPMHCLAGNSSSFERRLTQFVRTLSQLKYMIEQCFGGFSAD